MDFLIFWEGLRLGGCAGVVIVRLLRTGMNEMGDRIVGLMVQ